MEPVERALDGSLGGRDSRKSDETRVRGWKWKAGEREPALGRMARGTEGGRTAGKRNVSERRGSSSRIARELTPPADINFYGSHSRTLFDRGTDQPNGTTQPRGIRPPDIVLTSPFEILVLLLIRMTMFLSRADQKTRLEKTKDSVKYIYFDNVKD